MTRVAQHQEYAEKTSTDPRDLREMRNRVSDYLQEEELIDLRDDVLLVLTELVGNVYKHVRDPEAEVRIKRAGQNLVLSVSDSSRKVPRAQKQEWDSPGGRGLFLVASLDPQWMIAITGAGKRISVNLPIPGAVAEWL